MGFLIQCRQNIYFLSGFLIGLILSIIVSVNVSNNSYLFSIKIISLESDSGVNAFVDGEYEPRINSAAKSSRAQKSPQLLVRPRYFSTELGIKERLFVGVLTSYESVSSCGIVLNKTMSHLVDRLMFFINAPGPQKLNMSLLKLPGIVRFTNTRYFLRPFHALKYISDNFIDEFDFFFLIKDEAYVKSRSLINLLQSLSVSEYIHAGMKIDAESSFCSLDSGLLLSNAVLQKLQANLDWCVKNTFSQSDDDNVGRCILHSTNLPCRQKLKNFTVQSYRLEKKPKFEHSYDILQKHEMFDVALTIYPTTEPALFFRLHAYFSKKELDATERDILSLRRRLLRVPANVAGGPQAIAWPFGNQHHDKAQSRFDVLRWNYFNETHVYFDSDFRNLRSFTTPERNDLQNIVRACVSRAEQKYQGELVYFKLLNGYRKFDPSRGTDYVLDLIFRNKTNWKYIHKRFEVCKPLGKVEILPVPYVTENTRVNILLPVKPGNEAYAMKFLQHYRQICMMKRDKTFLMMVLLYDSTAPGKGTKSDIFKNLKNTAVSYSKQFRKDGNKIVWLSVRVPNKHPLYTDYHEALIDFATVDLALRKFRPDSLMLLARHNMEIKPDYLNRVRMNTILNWQVFSPIPFREYHPDIVYTDQSAVELELHKANGLYASTNTQHISFYASDYLIARQTIKKTVPIASCDKNILELFQTSSQQVPQNISDLLSDTIYSMFTLSTNLHVMRAVEPGLRIRYEDIECPTFNH